MNRSELLPLLWKNDIPLEMRMMLCKLADLGVEIDVGVEFTEEDFLSDIRYAVARGMEMRMEHLNRLMSEALRVPASYFYGESVEDIEEGDAVAINRDGRVVRIGEVEVRVP